MTKFHIRLATGGDAFAFAAIERSACERFRSIPALAWIADEEPTSLEDHLALIAAGTVWVALDDMGVPVGFLLAERCGPALHICEFAVALARQGQGVGRQLVAACAAYARGINLRALTLTTFIGLSWNEPFYRHLGFELIGTADYDERLKAIFAREDAIGLPIDQRCAMWLRLDRAG